MLSSVALRALPAAPRAPPGRSPYRYRRQLAVEAIDDYTMGMVWWQCADGSKKSTTLHYASEEVWFVIQRKEPQATLGVWQVDS